MELSSTLLANLPDLPQVKYIRHAAQALGPRQDVHAFWLGGSFARGDADLFSDVDMRIAVAGDTIGAWREPDWAVLLSDTVVGQQLLPFAETSFLHHLIVSQGTIIDFFVQSVDHPISRDAQLIIKYNDPSLRDRIRAADRPERADLPQADPHQLKAAIEEFWIISHKHAKVLFRNLNVLTLAGIEFERALLTRLWYASLTGKDLGKQRPTVHLFTQAVRTLQEQLGSKALSVLGASLATRGDLLSWISLVRDEIAAVGRNLAAKHGFAYPEALEQTVRQSWTACEHLLRSDERSDTR